MGGQFHDARVIHAGIGARTKGPDRGVAAGSCTPVCRRALLRFWSEEGYLRNLAKLQGWIERKGWRTDGGPVWARYDPPFMPWFLRRNEILVPVSVP